jgi:hypothetical protein
MTRNRRADGLTVEKLFHDCLDVRFLRREGFFDDGLVTLGSSLKWPHVARMRIARYLLTLDLRGRSVPQHVRVSWTKVHLGGERPWPHCSNCQSRAAKLYLGLGGYFCRACIGNPPYATQLLSAGGRAHYRACKLRLRLDGEAQLSTPFPERPRHMHRRTYERLKRKPRGKRHELRRRGAEGQTFGAVVAPRCGCGKSRTFRRAGEAAIWWERRPKRTSFRRRG